MLASRPSVSAPAFTMTWVSSHPPVGETGVLTVTADVVTDLIVAGFAVPKSTSFTPDRFDPDSMTVVPPPAGPDVDEIAVTTGQALGGGERRRPTSASAM